MIKKILIATILFSFIACNKNKKDDQVVEMLVEENEKPHFILQEEIKTKLDDSIALYYSKLNNQEIWYKAKNRKALFDEIKNCTDEGLIPSDYQFEELATLEEKRKDLNEEELFVYDTLLTATFKKLATHLYKGKLNPKDIHSDWDIYKREPALSDSLQTAIQQERITSLFNNLKPQHLRYKTIKDGLKILNTFPDTIFHKIELKEKIELFDTISEIVTIKHRLKYWKDLMIADSLINTVYDSTTYLAVKQFQTRHGLKADGVIGKGTIKALNFSKKDRQEQMIANLERWKWFPYDFGEEYILVNLPDYSLNYVINNDTVSSHTIVVGREARRTPVLRSQISDLVFNPTWTVPPTILKEDLVPAASKSRGYFAKNNMTIFDGSGNAISADDWNPEVAKNYRYVQAPSYNNSLGVVKFNFPNRHSVYLHDTNHRDFFSREYKALSSGCVRVEKPIKLAQEILSHERKNWNKAETDSLLKRKNTKIIPIKHNINVFLLYWTSWSTKQQLTFREDIYNLDKTVYEALRN